DHLGSTRVVTRSDQSVVGRHDYLPFGEEIFVGAARITGLGYNSSDDTRQKFTSKERDSESSLDYFDARYFSSAQGRFTGVDPVSIGAGAKRRDPQSWNGYSYTRDNPLLYTDSTGEDYAVYINGQWYQVANPEDFEKLGYQTYDIGDKTGKTIGVTDNKGNNYTAIYVEGDPGPPVRAQDPDPAAE